MPQINARALATLSDAGDPAMPIKRAALVALIAEVLALHDPNFVVADRIREATLNGAHRDNRLALMGNPTRYCEVVHSTSSDSGFGLQNVVVPAHTFNVNLWVGYADDDDAASSSQAFFDSVVHSTDSATPGLIPLLGAQDSLQTAGEIAEIAQPTGVAEKLLALDYNAREYAHHLAFSITIR